MCRGYTCFDSKPYDGESFTTEEGDLTVAEQCQIIRSNLQVIAILIKQMQEAQNEIRPCRVSQHVQGS